MISEYKLYLRMLAAGESYAIFISKRLLMRTVLPFWILLFFVFLIPNFTFLAMVGLPILILYTVYLVDLYHYWKACNISKRAYVAFHTATVLLIAILSSILSKLLEEIWILCF